MALVFLMKPWYPENGKRKVEDLEALKSQCGTDPQGKVLLLRSQTDRPKNGKTYYAVNLYGMGELYADLTPASLSQVEYLIIMHHDYDNAGKYKRTVFGQTDIFDFLRFKGRVELIHVTDNKTLFTSAWVKGTGEADLWGPEVWQGSNLPKLGTHVITAIEKIR